MRFKSLVIAAVMTIAAAGLSHADDFYKGKTIRVIVGGSAGGGFDIYTRAMARHMGKYIPGNPLLIVENMTGAGTLIAAKYLHSSAKPDGLSFGIFNGALILSGALGNKSVDFDMRELEYLGVPIQDNNVCALRKESGITNIDQWFAAKTPVKLGGLSPGNSTSDVPRMLLKAGAIDPAAVVRVYVTTPRTPKDRLQILNSAFAKTLSDADFIAEAKKANLDINPLNGAEVRKIVDDLFKLPPATRSKLAAILTPK